MCRISENVYIMVRHISETVNLAPLIIHSFPLLAPHHLLESEKFNIRYTAPEQIDNIPDKLRWYRYRKALLQREVADYIGVDRSNYMSYEKIGRDYYPIRNRERLADLYGGPVVELLDEFNRFLYNDQGKQIREKRLKMQLTQRSYAARLGVPVGSLKSWEQNKVRIFKSTWEKYFR